MHSRAFLQSFAILAAAASMAIPARAESSYSTSRFEITFGDGWQDQPSLVGSDSSVFLIYGYSMMGFCYMTASEADSPVSARDFENLRKQYAGADSMFKVAEGSETLGGKAFSFAEYKNADSSNGDTRIRIYTTSEGALRFQSLLVYDFSAGGPLIPALDSALGTLTFSPAPIRAGSPNRFQALPPADHDVLGRFRPMALRTAAFRLPER
jgi:hypothetical protein